MNATINLEKHFPVLLKELVSIISPLYGGTFIDCTFGAGGYSKKILENNLNNVIALDRDNSIKSISVKFQTKYKNRFKFYNRKFSDIDQIKNDNIKAIIFDLGYSLNQISVTSKLNCSLALISFVNRAKNIKIISLIVLFFINSISKN